MADDGVFLKSTAYPVGAQLSEQQDINPSSITRLGIELDGRLIPTLEEQLAKDKPLILEDLVKICDIVHVWLGDGFVALKYGDHIRWNIEHP